MKRRDVRYAVAYVLAAKDGLIQDPHPIKTITKNMDCPTESQSKAGSVNTDARCSKAGPADQELIEARMMEAAADIVCRVATRMRSAVERQKRLLPRRASLIGYFVGR